MSIKAKSTAVAIASVSTIFSFSVPSQAGEYEYLDELDRTEDPAMPWDYREGKRGSSAPQPSQSSHSPRMGGSDQPSCVNGDCDCSDFQTHTTAQQFSEADSGDSHRLDGDSDGVACESLQ